MIARLIRSHKLASKDAIDLDNDIRRLAPAPVGLNRSGFLICEDQSPVRSRCSHLTKIAAETQAFRDLEARNYAAFDAPAGPKADPKTCSFGSFPEGLNLLSAPKAAMICYP